MLYGYAGKMLFIDLSTGDIEEKETPKELAENFIGGYGFGAKILYDMMKPGTDPLGPDSVIGFITGPTSATKAWFGGRYTVVNKSPITGGWNDANSGGFFGPELKKAGYDALFIKGISPKPVYIYINNGKVEIRDASHLWGMDTKEVWEALKEETGEPRIRVSAIGPAGERVSLISCPINDGHRAPARGGTGPIMGSKKLKAIAVRGTQDIPVAHPDKVLEINKKVTEAMKNSQMAQAFGTYGTGVGTPASALSGDSPVKNWAGVGVIDFGEEKAEKLGSIALDRYKTKKYNCASCPLGCGAEYEVNDGRWPLGPTERPEYETAAAFGSTLLCGDPDVILKCNEICNRYGFDTISAGMTIAWAMECYERGILSKEDLDGIELTWGNGEAIVKIMEKMANGDGCGMILSHGSQYAANYWNKGKEYLQTASGIELPMHDPRHSPGLARTYKYDPTPGRHVKGGIGSAQMLEPIKEENFIFEGTGPMDLGMTLFTEVLNASSMCYFSILCAPQEAVYEYIAATTGMNFDQQAAFNAGLRIFMMRYAFNLREGIKPKDMTISKRAIGDPPLEAGPLKGYSVDVDKLGRNFFKEAGIDFDTGLPDKAVLERLGHLDEVIKDIYGEDK